MAKHFHQYLLIYCNLTVHFTRRPGGRRYDSTDFPNRYYITDHRIYWLMYQNSNTSVSPTKFLMTPWDLLHPYRFFNLIVLCDLSVLWCATKRTITSGLKSHHGNSPFTMKFGQAAISDDCGRAVLKTVSRLLLRPRNAKMRLTTLPEVWEVCYWLCGNGANSQGRRGGSQLHVCERLLCERRRSPLPGLTIPSDLI